LKNILVLCIDCGFCGFYIDLLNGLRWYEMDRATRNAFRLNKVHNPPGQNPGTSHWQYARCSKYLQEWADWDDSAPSDNILRDTLLKQRDCNGFTKYKPGLTPQEHLTSDQSDALGRQEDLEYDVFLSHSSEDDELAQRIKRLLEDSEIHTFATPSSIQSGLWNPKIEKALQRSRHLWLLLTPTALEKSIWSHQEFGYFYGHKSALGLDDADQRLHYFEVQSNFSRPGLYGHFQATPVPSFDDPVSLARVIAGSLSRDFNEPKDPSAWLLQGPTVKEPVPEIFDKFSLLSVSASGDATSLMGMAVLAVYTPITLFEVCIVGWHPQVKITSSPEHQVPRDNQGRIKLNLEWLQNEGPPETIIDSMNRQFRLERPRDPGDEWHPLYITFETDRHGIWGLVTYFKVRPHQKGFPEFSRISASAPLGWVRGQKSS
jgi:hypothetical protein